LRLPAEDPREPSAWFTVGPSIATAVDQKNGLALASKPAAYVLGLLLGRIVAELTAGVLPDEPIIGSDMLDVDA